MTIGIYNFVLFQMIYVKNDSQYILFCIGDIYLNWKFSVHFHSEYLNWKNLECISTLNIWIEKYS